jgi:methyl-accepting chemotaxis protein
VLVDDCRPPRLHPHVLSPAVPHARYRHPQPRHPCHQLGGAAEQVEVSSREIVVASSRLADAASAQAATIEKTSAASIQLGHVSQRNVQASGSALELILAMDQQIANANTDMKVMQTVVSDMIVSSKKIGNIVKLIDGIAFQTNILSLNAAVEAASAGSFGASFAVVAAEVGKLAKRATVAASDTAMLIEDALRNTQTGETAVAAVEAAMARVTGTAALVRTQISVLQNTSHEQEASGALIKQSILQLGSSAQETAAGAEESAAAGACIAGQAGTLREIVLILQQ